MEVNEMGATIGSGCSETRERPNWSPLYFLLAIVSQAMNIAPVLILALDDDISATEKWLAVAMVAAFSVFAGLICGVGIKEAVKEANRESAKG